MLTPKIEFEEALEDAVIWVDPNTKHILRVKIELADSHKEYSPTVSVGIAKLSLTGYSGEYHFRQSDDLCYITFGRANGGVKISSWIDKFDGIELKTLSDIMILDAKANASKSKPSDPFKGGTLYPAGTHYDNPYWETTSNVPLTTEYQKVLEEIMSKP